MSAVSLKAENERFKRFIPAVSRLLTFYYKIKVRLK
jgi:hypothetical protein